jgi:hypothetical protein
MTAWLTSGKAELVSTREARALSSPQRADMRAMPHGWINWRRQYTAQERTIRAADHTYGIDRPIPPGD